MEVSRAWFNGLPSSLRGIVWISAGTVCFASMIIFVRLASGVFNAVEIAFWRALFGVFFMLPFLARYGLETVRTRRFGVHFLRNIAQTLGMVSWFYAIGHINLAEGMALQFTVPLFTMAMAVVFLKEKFDGKRWTATLLGFAGVLVILRPGIAEVSFAALVTLFAAVQFAASNTVAKALSRTDSSTTIVFYMNLIVLPLSMLSMVYVPWSWPGPGDWPWLLGVAVSGYFAHFFLAQAFRETEANVVMPFDFLKLIWVTLFAFLLFGQVPTLWSWLGGLVIFAATCYIVRRETRPLKTQTEGQRTATE